MKLRLKILNLLRRMINLELCRIETNSGEPYVWPHAQGYETREVDADTFFQYIHTDIPPDPFGKMFERGDLCIANFHDETIVGFAFNSTHPTWVTDQVEFVFPKTYIYGFAAFTHPDHRGKRLARDRWKTSRELRLAKGIDPPSIYYTNLANIASLRADVSDPGQTPSILLGYSAYCEIGNRSICWRSRGARASGAYFRLRTD